MKSKDKLIELIKKQIRIENEIGKNVEKQLEMVHNSAAKLLLTEMKFDARKHEAVLQGILDVIADSDDQLWDHKIHSYVDKQMIKKELEKHVKTEKDTINLVKKEIEQTDDNGIKLLLQHIAQDEDRHHNLLSTIINNSYKINP